MCVISKLLIFQTIHKRITYFEYNENLNYPTHVQIKFINILSIWFVIVLKYVLLYNISFII